VAGTIGQPYRQMLSAALLDAGYRIESETTSARPYDELLYDAVYGLTKETRLTNQPMHQTSSGQGNGNPIRIRALSADRLGRVHHTCPGRAAANVCNTPKILSRRPGSCKAARVREVLESTVGADDEHLLQHRRQHPPRRLVHPDIYDDADDELDRAKTKSPHLTTSTRLPRRVFEWLDERDGHGLPAWLDDPEKVSAVEKLNAELNDRLPTPAEHAGDNLWIALRHFANGSMRCVGPN
jgi:hypothetical protein